MKPILSAFAVLLCLWVPAYGQPIQLVMETPASQIDRGQEVRHRFQIRNSGAVPILLHGFNEHVFQAPDFHRLCRMKMPGPRWETWINVLLPGQTKAVHSMAARMKPGAHVVKGVLRYGIVPSGSEKHWYKRITLDPKPNMGQLSICQRLGPVPTEAHVAYPDQLADKVVKRTYEHEWQVVVKQNPRLQMVTNAQQVTAFLDDVPYFGFVLWKGQTAFRLQDGASRPIGYLDRRTVVKLGETLARGKPFEVKADSPVIFAKTGLEISKREKLHATRAKLDVFSHVKTWYTIQIPADGLSVVRQILSTTGCRLHHDQYDGLVFTSDGPL